MLIAADLGSKATARPWHVTAKSASTAAAALLEASLTNLTLLEELSIWTLQGECKSDKLILLCRSTSFYCTRRQTLQSDLVS